MILAEGHDMKPGESVISPRRLAVTPGYFEAMNMRMTRGRTFSERDNETAQPVIIIDERLAQRFWPNGDPIGQRMYQPQSPSMKSDAKTRWLTVVGVVHSVRLEDLAGTGVTVNVLVPGGVTNTGMVPLGAGYDREEMIPYRGVKAERGWMGKARASSFRL